MTYTATVRRSVDLVVEIDDNHSLARHIRDNEADADRLIMADATAVPGSLRLEIIEEGTNHLERCNLCGLERWAHLTAERTPTAGVAHPFNDEAGEPVEPPTVTTLTVDNEGINVSVHASEKDAVRAFFLAEADQCEWREDDGNEDDFLVWATEHGGYVVYINTHEIPNHEEA